MERECAYKYELNGFFGAFLFFLQIRKRKRTEHEQKYGIIVVV